MNRMRALFVLAVLVLAPAPNASAQLLAAKDGPIVYGHHHLVVTDVAEHKKFWVDTLGGVAVTIGTQNREIVKFPNALLFMNPGKPTGGSRGTTVNHIGFSVPNLRQTIDQYLRLYAGHGHLCRDGDKLKYAFIHGNWCLANARRDGRWCGVDAELPVLFETGCYADFTFPAAPDESQPGIVNQIFIGQRNLPHLISGKIFFQRDSQLLFGFADNRIEIIALQA